jgi:hypothetical protein
LHAVELSCIFCHFGHIVLYCGDLVALQTSNLAGYELGPEHSYDESSKVMNTEHIYIIFIVLMMFDNQL